MIVASATLNFSLSSHEIDGSRMLVRRKTARIIHRPYTTGELNKTVDDLLHPLAKLDPVFLIVDGLLHGIIEQNPPESILKFIHYNLPKMASQLMRSRRTA